MEKRNNSSSSNSERPSAPSDSMSSGPHAAPGSSSSSVSYSGANNFTSEQSVSGESFSSSETAQNAVLVSNATVNFTEVNVEKTGDDDGDNSDFYGTNAAILVHDGGTLNMDGGIVKTNGSHANGVFACSNGTINISNTSINTSSNNSGGIMVTGGGVLNATNLTVNTSGNSSAPIRSDRGGGTMNISGGNYESSGVGSPVIYSTADVNVDGASLVSLTSEGVVIEGSNSVKLENVMLTATNHRNNGHSETFKSIFIYQSMSGDASEGTGTFSAKNSTVTTNSGDHFFITNTTAEINLEANQFVQNDTSGGFLRAQSGYWGNSGSNGGIVTLNATSQNLIGDFNIDGISSISLNLTQSYLKGALLGEGYKALKLSKDSIVVLTNDSYISLLENELSDNTNIYANGHKLFVNGAEVSINQAEAPESFLKTNAVSSTTAVAQSETTTSGESGLPIWGIVLICVVVLAVAAGLSFLIAMLIKKKSSKVDSDGNFQK